MEQPGQDQGALGGCLIDLQRINRYLGGTRLTLWGMEQLAGHLEPGAPLSVLDVATGSADIPQAVGRWARHRGLNVSMIASDLSHEILVRIAPDPDVALRYVVADGRRLPFDDRSVDVSGCSLALHHFDPDDAVVLLRELRRIARLGVVVNDLVRTWHGYAGAWLVGRLFTNNPITRHDALLSVKRAYTRGEMASLGKEAGLGPVRFAGFLGYRVAMVAGEKRT